MHSDSKILKAKKNHIQVIEDFQKENLSFFENNIWYADELENFILYKKNLILIAFLKKKIVGLSIFIHVGNNMEIYSIFVSPSSRGKKIGSSFIDKARIFCKKSNIPKIFLEVNENNQRAISFYKNHNFHICGRRKGYYTKPKKNENAVLMESAL